MLAVASCTFGVSARADAEPLTADETVRLERGETIVREQTYESGDRRYIGGLTYTVVDATTSELASLLEDERAYVRVLPRTKHVRLVGATGSDRLLEVVQGNALVEASYTLRLRKVAMPPSPSPRREVRFWLEPSLPHGIDDAWGFFRMDPFIGESGTPRVLLTYGVLVDTGPGLVRDLFEERVRTALLSVPQLVRRYLAQVRRLY